VSGAGLAANYSYNGLGDRLEQTANSVTTQYVLDMASGLTQVLDDEANAYLYGVGRIGEQQPDGWQYYLGDALGSVRQLTDETGEISLAKSYLPYGEAITGAGGAASAFGYTGESVDEYTNLVFLRARWYSPLDGRFLSKDVWQGDYVKPISYNNWLYGSDSPVVNTDPSGLCDDGNGDGRCDPRDCPAIPDPNPVPDPDLITFTGQWVVGWETSEIKRAALDVGNAMALTLNRDPYAQMLLGSLSNKKAFLLVYGGPVEFKLHVKSCSQYFVDWRDQKIKDIGEEAFHAIYGNEYDDAEQWTCWGYTYSSYRIYRFSNKPPNAYDTAHWAIHELGHAFNSEINNQGAWRVRHDAQWDDILKNRDRGFLLTQGHTRPWQQSGSATESEIFADMFLGWVYNAWADDQYGTYRSTFMTQRMSGWLVGAALNNR
jgi:RHS repeat-associated protein